jgi:hypothetical protein
MFYVRQFLRMTESNFTAIAQLNSWHGGTNASVCWGIMEKNSDDSLEWMIYI